MDVARRVHTAIFFQKNCIIICAVFKYGLYLHDFNKSNLKSRFG